MKKHSVISCLLAFCLCFAITMPTLAATSVYEVEAEHDLAVVNEDNVKALGIEYEKIPNGYRLFVANTSIATDLIVRNPHLFNDYEITKGKMDAVFLAVTGKTLVGGIEK